MAGKLASILFLLSQFINIINAEVVTVTTDLGSIRGTILKSDNGQDYLAFRAIPYAKPPAKELRFKVPQPIEAWTGTLDATEDGASCIQFNMMTSIIKPEFEGDEDCLFLNVYIPRKVFDKNDLTPVMVFLHGGGFTSGSGTFRDYGPQRFMDKDVVLVTVNYRLGPLGFLSTGDKEAPGNYGLLDQVMALKWVKDNIDDFRGDPDSITIFGESAGGASVSYHVLSPLSKGLFHGAIHQSGNAVAGWAYTDVDLVFSRALKLGESLKCSSTSPKELVDCLRKKPALDIVYKSFLSYMDGLAGNGASFGFGPTTDFSRDANAFLPQTPMELLRHGAINIVPTLSGVVKDEGSCVVIPISSTFGGLKTDTKKLLSVLMPMFQPQLARDPKKVKRVVEKVYNAFFTDIDQDDFNQKVLTLIEVLNYDWLTFTDDYNKLLVTRGADVYAYKFTYRGHQSWLQRFTDYKELPENFMDDNNIVSHFDEVHYQFLASPFNDTNLVGDEKQMSEIFLNLWISFARNKKPSSDSPDIWNPITLKDYSYYDISLNTKTVSGYLNQKWELWKKVLADEDIHTEL